MGTDNVIELIIRGTDAASDVVNGVINKVTGAFDGMSKKMVKAGAILGIASAPLIGGLTDAVNTATVFDESMTNVQSVLGATTDEVAALSDDILALGADSRAGPQAAADAFYDIVGGVADASSHMAILDAAIATSEAGAADLGATTSVLISTMNSYGYAADKAAYASDVLTRTVGMGVGTMDEFAAAMPQVTGLASSLGISFDDLGAQMAFLTTKGFGPSQAATQLRAMMTSLLNPNAKMVSALEELGYANGTAAIDQLGLVGAFEALSKSSPTFQDNMAGAIGSVEALNGVIALTGGGFSEFDKQYTSALDGATAAAQEIQLGSVAAQTDLLKSSLSALKIEIGAALLPAINDVVRMIRPVITSVTAWVGENPKLISTLAKVVAGVAGLGGALAAAGAVMGMFSSVLGLVLSPIGLVIAGVVALVVAFKTNFLGIGDVVRGAAKRIGRAVKPIIDTFEYVAGWIGKAFDYGKGKDGLFGGIIASLRALFYVFEDGKTTFFSKVFQAFGMSEQAAQKAGLAIVRIKDGIVNFFTAHVVPLLQSFYDFLGQAWTIVGPALEQLADWFLNTALPAIVGFVADTVIPAVSSLIDILRGIWEWASPYLLQFVDWVVNTGLPAVVDFIKNTAIPAVGDLIDWLGGVWEDTKPHLENLYNWFVEDALPAIGDFITGTAIPAVEMLIDTIVDIWNLVKPELEKLYDWFVEDALPAIGDFITDTAIPSVEMLIDTIVDIWNLIKPTLDKVYDWFVVTALPAIKSFIVDTVIPAVGDFIDILVSIWNTIKPTLDSLYDWFVVTALPAIKSFIVDTVIPAVGDFIDILKSIWDTVKPALDSLYDWFINSLGTVKEKVIDPIADALGDVIDTISSVGDSLSNLKDKLPDWMIPGSPTPFELGVRGISDAMRDMARINPFSGMGQTLVDTSLPRAMQPAFATASGGGNSYSVSVPITFGGAAADEDSIITTVETIVIPKIERALRRYSEEA
ncbi:MAG TPA: phage tail tape measure protein [Aggregatilinea sp.]|uniref:phage tail tape measure protein n=1 Tax=Aggregatilinea sp. TaxID=2806333 RepID=UPI002CEC3432|nr:phage tail tape measure protein [Aggregatilinea sp.]HML23522.1 phage tail tape measure protein [Aggregatilinea sp.]